jgi:hypothetical protein
MSSQAKPGLWRVNLGAGSVTGRPFGLSPAEVVVALLVVLSFAALLGYYSLAVKPKQSELANLRAEFERQKDVLIKSVTGGGSDSTPKNAATQALETLETFRAEYLKPRLKGQRALIDEINALAKKHSTPLTSGLEMSLANIDTPKDEAKRSGGNVEAALEVFPRLAIKFTVVGQYDNLRALMADLERNKQFLVIESVTLSSVERTDSETGRRMTAPGTGISLSIGMSVYFQPEAGSTQSRSGV